mmetsp:Transcript_302/g.941  ORF Transcript_302/g.941 Transcript_302/m.941 type:complete len:303 (+) Transcript_302:504-1412(+)
MRPTRRLRRDTSTGGSTFAGAGALSFFSFLSAFCTPPPASGAALSLAAFSFPLAAASGALAVVLSFPFGAGPPEEAPEDDPVAAAAAAASLRSAWEPENRSRRASTSSSEMPRNSGSGLPAPSGCPTGRSSCRRSQRCTKPSSMRSWSGSRPSWVAIRFEMEGMKGARTVASTLTRPMQAARRVPQCVESVLNTTHGCCSWKKRLPALEMAMAVAQAERILAASMASTYSFTSAATLVLSSITSGMPFSHTAGTFPSKREAVKLRALRMKLPRLLLSSALFLAARSAHLKSVSEASGRLPSR